MTLFNKKTFKHGAIAVVLASTFQLTGCGALIGMQAASGQFAFTQVQPLNEVQPVKSDVFKQVKSVGIIYYGQTLKDMNYSEDNTEVYKLMTRSTEKYVEKSNKYKVIDRYTFEKALKKVEPNLDVLGTDPDEWNQIMAKAGRELGVHALVEISLEEANDNVTSISNQLVMAKDLVLNGAAKIPMNLQLKMIRSRNGEVLYSQYDLIDYEMGTSGLSNTKPAQRMATVDSAIKPLVDDMISRI